MSNGLQDAYMKGDDEMSDDRNRDQEAQTKAELSEIRKGTHLTPLVDQSEPEPVSPAAISANAAEGESGSQEGGGAQEEG
jgi:hypothetical protein